MTDPFGSDLGKIEIAISAEVTEQELRYRKRRPSEGVLMREEWESEQQHSWKWWAAGVAVCGVGLAWLAIIVTAVITA